MTSIGFVHPKGYKSVPITTNAEYDLTGKLMQYSWLQHRRLARDIIDLNLTVPQFIALNSLVEVGGEMAVGQLAKTTNQVSATMTGITDRLTRDGLVERKSSKFDRRTVLIAITESGREVVNIVRKRTTNTVEAVLQGVGEQERTVAYQFIDFLVTGMAV